MMYSNVIVGITISHGLFVFSQSRVKVTASLTNVGSLTVGAFDLDRMIALYELLILLGSNHLLCIIHFLLQAMGCRQNEAHHFCTCPEFVSMLSSKTHLAKTW